MSAHDAESSVDYSDPSASDTNNADETQAQKTAEYSFVEETPLDEGNMSVETRKPLSVEKEYSHEEISHCLQQNQHLQSLTNKLIVHYDEGGSDDANDDEAPMTCTISVTTPQQMFQVKLSGVGVGHCSLQNYVNISDGENSQTWHHTCDYGGSFFFNATHSSMTLVIRLGDPTVARHTFQLSAVATSEALEIVYLSPSQGYIQTVGFGEGKAYQALTDAWLQMSPPLDHVTLLSVHRLHLEADLCFDRVDVYAGGTSEGERVWRVCATSPPRPTLLDTREIHVHFKTDFDNGHRGFQLLYSYHPASRQPSRINGGLWNCTVAEWPAFADHFRCNVERECEGGEDEADCFYTGHCGQGYLTLDDRCYSYVRSDEALSWPDANQRCVTQGGHLASLNTPREWDSVSRLLQARRDESSIYIGLKTALSALPFLYRDTWQWADGSTAFYGKAFGTTGPKCGQFKHRVYNQVKIDNYCNERRESHYLCEMAETVTAAAGMAKHVKPAIELASLSEVTLSVPYVTCPGGHLTHAFMACDVTSACWADHYGYAESEVWEVPSRASCPVPVTSLPMRSLPAMFTCSTGSQRVPYSLVCDHRQQCADSSDETFCVFAPCSGSTPLQCATSTQCIEHDANCNQQQQCVDGTDEADCRNVLYDIEMANAPPPAYISYENYDGIIFQAEPIPTSNLDVNGTLQCADTHFQCQGNGYCLPVYMRCNGVADCPGREDEEGCESATCPGYYRCRGSTVCLHVMSVCDRVDDCPQLDDELYCDSVSCPDSCTCHALAFTCNTTIQTALSSDLRYLDAAGSGMRVGQLSNNTMLIHLGFSRCRVKSFDSFTFPNLRSLDLTDNLISSVDVSHLRGLGNLQVLILSGNPVTSLFPANPNLTLTLPQIELLDVSGVALEEIHFSNFAPFPNLQTLNLSHSNVRRMRRSENESLPNIRVLDLRGCHVTSFQYDVMLDFEMLESLYAESYKLCCPVVLPTGFNPTDCQAPQDLASSCDRLLSSSVYRVLLPLCCGVALLGNAIIVISNVLAFRNGVVTATCVFSTHLAVGDAVMGVSVAVLAVADRLHQGSYVLVDTAWRQGVACRMISFLFLLSSQLTVSFVLLLTIDRVLPLSSKTYRLSFKPVSAHVMCVVIWVWCLLVSVLPLLPGATSGELFNQTALCVPLPVIVDQLIQLGEATFFVFVLVFYCVLMLLTAVGLTCIYISLQNTTPFSDIKSCLYGSHNKTTTTGNSTNPGVALPVSSNDNGSSITTGIGRRTEDSDTTVSSSYTISSYTANSNTDSRDLLKQASTVVANSNTILSADSNIRDSADTVNTSTDTVGHPITNTTTNTTANSTNTTACAKQNRYDLDTGVAADINTCDSHNTRNTTAAVHELPGTTINMSSTRSSIHSSNNIISTDINTHGLTNFRTTSPVIQNVPSPRENNKNTSQAVYDVSSSPLNIGNTSPAIQNVPISYTSPTVQNCRSVHDSSNPTNTHSQDSVSAVVTTNITKSIPASSPTTQTPAGQDVSLARRVFSSCVLSVVCWLSLSLLTVLAWRGSSLPAGVHVHIVFLALPITSALRPFLHALGVRGEKRRRERAERWMAYVVAQRRQKGRRPN